MAELKFGITGDSSSFKKALDDATRGVSNARHQIEQEGKSMASVFDGLKNAAMGLGLAFGLNELKNLGNQIVKTRGQFQDLETSFKTMLGSASKGKALMDQLTQTAATTPFGLQDVAGGAKQLLAYGIEAEKVNEMLIRLGDIASGLSIPLNDLVYLYGTTMTQGRMFTQDLRQFQGRGIPIADELAKQFGIAKSQVGDFVTAGKVGAKEVEQAIINMTSEGSKFGGLMAEQSSTFGGKISNLEDQVDMLYNAIGKDMEGTIVDILDSAAKAIDFLSKNYKELGFSIMGIVSAYGAWKAGMMAHNAIAMGNAINEKAAVDAVRQAYEEEISTLHELHAVQQEGQTKAVEVDTSDIDQAVSTGALSQEQADELIHLRELTAEKQLSAETALVNASALVKERQEMLNNAEILAEMTLAEQENLQAKLDSIDVLMEQAEQEGEAEELLALSQERAAVAEELSTAATDANNAGTQVAIAQKELDAAKTQQQTAAKNLSTASSKANTAATLQNTNAQKAGTVATQSSTLADRIATASKNALTFATNKLKLAWQSLKGAFMSNPIGLILTAVTTAITLFMSWKSKQEELNKAVGEGVEKAKAFNEALQQENNAIESHVKTIRDANANKAEQVKAYNELMQLVPELTKEYTRQELAAMSATQAERLLTEALREREVAQMEKGRATAQSTLQTLNGGADEWKSLSPEQRKFLKEDFALDAATFEEDVDLVKQQLRGYIGELDDSIYKTKEFNKVLELTELEKSADKMQKMTQMASDYGKKIANIEKIGKLINSDVFNLTPTQRAEQSATEKYGKEKTNEWRAYFNEMYNSYVEERKKYQDKIIEISSQYGISIQEIISGNFLTSGENTMRQTFFDTHFAPILEAYKQNKTTLEQEIQADSGIKTEIELIAEMSEEELESELDAAYKEVKWIKERIDELSQDTFDEGTDVGYTFSIDAYPNTDNATGQINTAKDNLDNYTGQTFGRPLNVDTSANVNARVNLSIEKGIVNNPSGLSSSIFGASDFFQALSGGGFTPQKTLLGNLSNFGQDKDAQIAFLTGQLEIANDRINVLTNRLEEKTKSKPTSTPPKSKSKKGTGKSTGSKRSTSKTGKTKQELEKEFKDAQEDLTQLQEEQAQELADIAKDRENTLTQLSIDLSAEGNAKYIKQMELNAKKQNEEYEKERREAIAKVRKMREDIHDANQEVIAAEKSKNAGKEVKYTKEKYDPNKDEEYKRLEAETNAYYNQLIAENNQKTENEIYLAKRQSQWEYLKQYGSAMEQELALTEEYNAKIAKARSKGEEWEAKSLEKERDASIQSLKDKKLVADIDWAIVFHDMGLMMQEEVGSTLAKLRAYTQTEEFKSQSLEDQQIVYDAISKFEKELGGSIKSIGMVREAYDKYKASLDSLRAAEQKRDFIQSNLNNAKKLLSEAEANGNDMDIEMYRAYVESFTTQLNEASTEVDQFKDATNAAKNEWQSVSATATATIEGLAAGLSGLTSGSIQGIAEGLSSLPKELGGEELAKALGDPIVSAIIKLLDVLKDGIDELLVSAINTILGAVNGLLSSVLSTDIFVNVSKALAENVGNILDTLTFGLLNIEGDSVINYEKKMEQLSAYIEALSYSIDELKTIIEKSSFMEATDAYEQALERINQSMASTQEQMQLSAKNYNKGFLGISADHSSGYKIDKGMSTKGWQRVSNILGISVKSASEFFNLTSEQMATIAREAPDIYAKIKDLADDGHSDAAQYMDDYINYYKQLEELENQWQEKLTGTSFDSIRDEYKNALLDMESDNETFAQSFEDTMRNAIIDAILSGEVGDAIQEWYDLFAEYMQDGLDKSEVDELRRKYLAIQEWGESARDAAYEVAGINPESSSSSSTSASGRGIETATQEQVSELNGRFTALQIAGEAIRTQSSMTNGLLQALTQQLTPSITASEGMNATLKELRELAWQRNNYLSDISDYSKNLVAIKKSLSQIESNTQNL